MPATTGAKKPTLYDVAALAGVSHQTVSRLVKGHTNIRPEIRARVEKAIAELDYRPNIAARSLATNRNHRIGALVYEILEVGPSKILQGASNGAREAGYLLDIVSLDPGDDDAIEQAVSLIAENQFAGILVFAPTDSVVGALGRVSFTVPLEIESESTIVDPGQATPNEIGTRQVVDHLSGLGHRRFAHVSGPLDWFASRGRRDAYRAEVERIGGVSTGEYEGDWTSRSGYEAALGIPLGGPADPTALICGNDQMALGVLAALAERGIDVPGAVSVTGFDDVPESSFYRPALTSVRPDFERQGRSAILRLIARITEADAPERDPLDPELRVRASTGPLRDTTAAAAAQR